MPKFTFKSIDKAALKEFDQKSAVYQTLHANKSFNRNPTNHRLYHALMEALIDNENAMDKGVADIESVEEPTAEVVMDDAGPAYNLLKGTCSSSIKLEYHFQACFNALMDKLDWNNPEGDRYPFDLSKPLYLQGHPGHLTIIADYFFNNDLEYLKSSDPKRTYTTSLTKTKAARYEIKGIEEMVPALWSPTNVGVKKLHGYGHLEEIMVKRVDRQLYKFKEAILLNLLCLFVCSQEVSSSRNGLRIYSLDDDDDDDDSIFDFTRSLNKFSKHNVYSTKKILGVKSVSVKKLHGYGHLEEIMVKRVDRQLYKFKEGDFVDLHINDIEDMLLLDV
nr:hypothetical protein [Tanacetum cinerariifolium]